MSPDVVRALVGILEVKDLSTAAHTWRVVLYTRALAEHADLDREVIERLSFAAALHDVGKIDIPDEILVKPGRLTSEEFEAMKSHAALGHERMIRMGETDPILLNLVRHHHERLDGLGYPDGLKGDQVPLAAAYFSVIDSFDAMTSIRPYRSDVGPRAAARAMAELKDGVGTRYCPDAVSRFGQLFETGRLNWILEYFNDSCPMPDYSQLDRLDQIVARTRPAD
ncbi:Cyclic di-GMP phosphodiesterase [Phycisphaerales bacterium]|nr:Cyclic di-GMP phosphodiesterase [Phycisphaerales bacterium]